MNISKALKEKNRMAGEITTVRNIIIRENARRTDQPRKVDVIEKQAELMALTEKLASLKGKIALASAPIVGNLAKMEELKGLISFYDSLPVREGKEKDHYGNETEWKSAIPRHETDSLKTILQQELNRLQDEVDDFNGRTQI